jgi:polysaccharide deacetylase 2 family uncharacterized protein YibQ
MKITKPLTLGFFLLILALQPSLAYENTLTPLEKSSEALLSPTSIPANHHLPNTKPTVNTPARLAIIIDDLGNSLRSGLDAIALPAPITFAVMPHRKHSKALAERAGRLGKDVLLHAPMSTVNGDSLGAGALTENLAELEFKNKLRFSIASMPYVSGLNNHMGSELTTRPQAMKWVMEVLTDEQLFFVDSRTHAKSIAYKTALQMGLPTANRDIFLDNEINIDHIHIQFKKALAIAKRYGSAIVIGHPHKATLTYLNHVLPQLEGSNVAIHSVSDLLKTGIAYRPDSARESRPAKAPSLDALIKTLQASNPQSL